MGFQDVGCDESWSLTRVVARRASTVNDTVIVIEFPLLV